MNESTLTTEKTAPARKHSAPTVEVRVSGLSKGFQRRRENVRVLKEVNLEVRKGELLVLLGPSGCGKTTLLRCLVGLERPGEGQIELGGDLVADPAKGIFTPPNRRNVGMVFQNYALWPHMKVSQNVAYPLKARKLKSALAGGRVEEVLDIVQCGHLADRYPPELSGGQQQRVSLARALAPQPAVLLFDEPLSNLDALLRLDMRAQLRRLHRSLGFTGVYVTHDQEEALSLGTRVAVMNDGRIEQIGAPQEVYRNPASERVADFLGARNSIPMVVDRSGASMAGRRIPDSAAPSLAGEYIMRIRPGHVQLRRPSEHGHDEGTTWLIGGTVVEILPGADRTEYIVELGDSVLYVEIPVSGTGFHIGSAVDVGLPHASTHCYGEDGALVPTEHVRVGVA
ncbi:ABC transporter ATP-binding protein [Rhodococcus sp. NPDC127530]|uniref:ABC transporter ATP-binding protein n=1 Tax=unclassified Rhodococcus (in: high G+C Gram-positive bacteria) TaxID=192944 RepID=UPI0036370D36